jgi:hypothetical protein
LTAGWVSTCGVSEFSLAGALQASAARIRKEMAKMMRSDFILPSVYPP